MIIKPDHFLDRCTRNLIAGGAPMENRRLLVIHFTAGASALSSIDAMRERGVSAHIVIDRDGTVYQCRGFNRTCGHAGGPGDSRWRDPSDSNRLYNGVNGCGSIGVEMANAGDTPIAWAKKQPGYAEIQAKHRNGGPLKNWEIFYPPQLAALDAVTDAIMTRYNLDDITGHDCVAPERKADPGPAFEEHMLLLRKKYGFPGLPVVHLK